MVTGKGNHSKHGKAILFPKVKEFLHENNIKFKDAKQGKIFCEIIVS